MAIVNLTAMSALTAPADSDVLYIVDDPASAALPRKITYADIMQRAYGSVTVNDASTAQSLSATTWTKLTAFTADGLTKNTTNAHASDKVTVTNAGIYLVNLTANFTTGAATDAGLAVYWNGSATVAKSNRTTSTTSDVASVAVNGLINATAGTDFEVYAYLGSATTITIKDMVLTVVRVA